MDGLAGKQQGILYQELVDAYGRSLVLRGRKPVINPYTEQLAGAVLKTEKSMYKMVQYDTLEIIDFARPLFVKTKRAATFRLGLSRESIRLEIRRMRNLIFILAAGGWFLGLLAILLLTQVMVRPLQELVLGMEELEQGDYQPKTVPLLKNEMGILVSAFTSLCRTLQMRREQENAVNEDIRRLHLVMDAPVLVQDAVQALKRLLFFNDYLVFLKQGEEFVISSSSLDGDFKKGWTLSLEDPSLNQLAPNLKSVVIQGPFLYSKGIGSAFSEHISAMISFIRYRDNFQGMLILLSRRQAYND